MSKINLGDQVKDKVTGFTGIATARVEFLNGCTRIAVQTDVLKDGLSQDSPYIDEPQLEVVKKEVVECGPRDTGGPCPSIPTRHSDPTR